MSCVTSSNPEGKGYCALAAVSSIPVAASQCQKETMTGTEATSETFPVASKIIKVISTDLDGTFFNEEHNVSYRNAAAFKAAKDAGYIVLVATGRSRKSAVECIGEETLRLMDYENTSPGVFMNGMVVYGKNGELLYEHAMDEKNFKSLVQLVRDEGIINNFLVYEGPDIWCEDYNEYTAIPHSVHGEVKPKVADKDISEKKCNKVVVCAHDDVLVSFRSKINDKFGDVFDTFYALPNFLEIVPKGANKMSGIEYLLKDLGVDPSCVMGIGDSENDSALLKGIGFPMAVGNACDSLKSIAKHVVCRNNGDAFAEAVEILCNIHV